MFKSKQQKAGERLLKSLGSNLDYQVWTPKKRNSDGWIFLESACSMPGIDVFIVPEGNNWELWIGESDGSASRRYDLASLKASADEVFRAVDFQLSYALQVTSMSDLASLAAGTVLFNTREMFGDYVGAHDARLQTQLLLLTQGPNGVNPSSEEILQNFEIIAAEAISMGSFQAKNLLDVARDFKRRIGL